LMLERFPLSEKLVQSSTKFKVLLRSIPATAIHG
jgi:hypothetical protein